MRLAGAVLALLAIGVAIAVWSIELRIAYLENITKELPVNLSKSWVSGGVTVTVSIDRLKKPDGSWAETTAEWKARFEEALAEALEAMPPDR